MPRADGDFRSAPSETAAAGDPEAYEDTIPSLPILDVPVSLVDMAVAVGLIPRWPKSIGGITYVFGTSMV